MAVILLLLIGCLIGSIIFAIYTSSKKKGNLGKTFPVPSHNFPVYIGKSQIYLENKAGGFLADEAPDVEPGSYYVTRSCASEAVVLSKKGKTWYVLANKRGHGCLNDVGMWNVPSGYVEYGETCEAAAVRETFEETGVHIKAEDLKLYTVDSTPEGRQNIVLVYYTVIDKNLTDTSTRYCKPGEVDEVLWIPEDNLDNVRWISYEHIKRVKNIIQLVKDKEEK